jgi:transposase
MRPHGTPAQLEQRRRRAVELLDKGLNPPDVAERIDCSLSSVYYWDDLRKKKGEDALKPKPAPGRPEKLGLRQKRSLTQVLLKGAMKNGYSTDLWTLKRISQVVDKRFGVAYHPAHVWKILQDLGWSCQKPERQAKERDEKKVKHWVRYQWPHIKKVQKA